MGHHGRLARLEGEKFGYFANDAAYPAAAGF